MGRFTLRLPKTLHDELEVRAQNEGVSLNQCIVYVLTRQVASAYTIQVLPEETVGEQKERFEKLLDSLGDASITATKAFLAEREAGDPEDGLTDEIVAGLKEKIEKAQPEMGLPCLRLLVTLYQLKSREDLMRQCNSAAPGKAAPRTIK